MTENLPDLQGRLLWEPTPQIIADANLTRFMGWLRETRDRDFTTYDELWRWSVSDLEGFWGAVWDYFGVRSRAPYEKVLATRKMPQGGVVPRRGVELR